MLKPAVMTLASLFLYSSQSMAAMQCAPGLTHVSVNGNVTTLNVSATRQAGQICMTMIRTSNGSEAFNDCGALVGNVVSADLESGSSSLTHTAVFDLRDMLVTRNDHAQITGVLTSMKQVRLAHSTWWSPSAKSKRLREFFVGAKSISTQLAPSAFAPART